MSIETVKALIVAIGILWAVVFALLIAACLLLMSGSKKRFAVGIIAFSCSGFLSLVWVIGVTIADRMAISSAVEATTPLLAMVVSHSMQPTLWPWIVLVISLIGLAYSIWQTHLRKQEREQEQKPAPAEMAEAESR